MIIKKRSDLSIVFNALSSETRLKILNILASQKEKNIDVPSLAKILKIDLALTRYHVNILETASLVKSIYNIKNGRITKEIKLETETIVIPIGEIEEDDEKENEYHFIGTIPKIADYFRRGWKIKKILPTYDVVSLERKGKKRAIQLNELETRYLKYLEFQKDKNKVDFQSFKESLWV